MTNILISKHKFSYFELHANTIRVISQEKILEMAKIYSQLFVKNKVKVVISILSNSTFWNTVDISCLSENITHIPLFDNTRPETLQNILNEINSDLIIYDKQRHIHLIERCESNVPQCCHIDQLSSLKRTSNSIRKSPSKVLDAAIILYTSGSNGMAKGIIHSLKNLEEAINTFYPIIKELYVKRALSYLPLSFSGERKLNYTYQYLGIDICYAARSKSILQNVLYFKPEVMAMVPSLLEQFLIELSDQNKTTSLKYIICGGALIKKELLEKSAQVGIEILEVYGLTETASIGTANTRKSKVLGSVGKALKDVEIHINSDNEINLFCKSLLTGYVSGNVSWKIINDKKFLPTGDLGYIDDQGNLFITGRKSNLIKLSNGKWIQLETLEEEIISLGKNQIKVAFLSYFEKKLSLFVISALRIKKVEELVKLMNQNHLINIENVFLRHPSTMQYTSKSKLIRKDLIDTISKEIKYEKGL